MKKILFLFLLFFSTTVFATEKIDINSASLADLDKLTGIGPTYAQRIIDGRPYSSVDDLDRVKGIGPTTIQKIKDQGLACVNCSSPQTTQATESPTSSANLNPVNNTTLSQNTAPEPVNGLQAGYQTGILINEVLPNPSGADETNEWVEIYNLNNVEVDLSGWKLKDSAGTTTIYVLPTNTKISANGFLVLKRPDTKIMLNNDEDGLYLLTPDDKTEDTMSFSKAPLGQSYSKTNSGWSWSASPTPGATNVVIVATKALPKVKKSDNNSNIAEAGTADISQILSANQGELKTNNPWFLFFTVLSLTVILATAVLFIKFKLNKTNVRT